MNYRQHLLNSLLDKYENSSHFFGHARINRRVLLNFNRKTLPQYFIGDRPQEKQAIHQAISELQAAGILTVEWLPGEKGNLLKSISLNLEYLETAYNLTNRIPKSEQLTELIQLLTSVSFQTPWLSHFKTSTLLELEANRTVPSPLPADIAATRRLLQALAGLDQKGETEVSERIFSIRYLGHSKLFSGKIRATIITLARTYLLKDLELSDEDVLSELGIVKTSAEILLAGPITLTINGNTADLAPLSFGAVIDTHQASLADIAALNTDTILLVENKTNYHELIRHNLSTKILIIYLGGFPGPGKRRFLTTLGNHCDHTTNIYHWGDIDWGGFRIHRILKDTAFPTLKPLLMDTNTLLNHIDMADTLRPAYKTKLTRLLQDPAYSEFHPTIEQMLKHNIRLEQEAILARNDFTLPL